MEGFGYVVSTNITGALHLAVSKPETTKDFFSFLNAVRSFGR
jgi:hypothetical protein